MSKLSKLGMAAAAALLATQAVAAEPVRYWGVHAGASTLESWDAAIDFGAGAPFNGQVELERGVHGGVAVGRQSGHLRYELEYETGRMEVTRLTLAPLSEAVDGKGRYQAVFANAFRTDRLSGSLDSFIGGGIGWGRVKLPLLGLGDSCKCFGPADKSGLAWQLRAGLGYRLAAQHSLTLQYTWLKLPEPEGDGPPAIAYARRRFGAVTVGYTRQF
ncbi:outer membrane protein [Massilia sp. GCM10020059]|uniref:Porin family protein n=1 Tax=Massilia agrisoli TaxID=2892444 RepID=A0ABS8ITT9_9BURK|nr:outer membrane beta-barrel protein [Massilia agrisoli]MCC6071969.1 porin family protein [Massilia agrisoli]